MVTELRVMPTDYLILVNALTDLCIACSNISPVGLAKNGMCSGDLTYFIKAYQRAENVRLMMRGKYS